MAFRVLTARPPAGRRWRGIALLAAALTASPLPAACGTARAKPSGDCAKPSAGQAAEAPKGWRLTVSDDFSGGALQKCWRAYQKDSGSGHALSSLVQVGGGHLTVWARGNDTGAVALTSPPQKYGRYEVRACTQATRGSWSGIFLWPAGPLHSEIDMVEAANERHAWFNLHWGSNSEADQQIPFPGVDQGGPQFSSTDPSGASHCKQWHTWSFGWTPDALTLTMDGEQVVHRTDATMVNRFDQQMNLLIEMERGWAGNSWSNGAPAADSVSALYLDWIKVYSYAP